MANTNNEETVPCKWCDEPTYMLGTEECNKCWEVTSRLEIFLKKSQKARDFTRQLLSKCEETIHYMRGPFIKESTEAVDKQYKRYCQKVQDQKSFNFYEWCNAVGYVPVKR